MNFRNSGSKDDEEDDLLSFSLREALKNLRDNVNSGETSDEEVDPTSRSVPDNDFPTPYVYYFPYPKGPPTANAEGHLKILEFCPQCGEQNTLRKTKCASCNTSLLPSS
ncbi:MAG: hypothetical protein ACW97Z_17755 [Candidatus Hodarchaeales archaeon]|jgi:hypothetical protein